MKKTDHTCTNIDYRILPEDERWELLDGVAYPMSPSPPRTHQRVCGILFTAISIFLKQKRCEPFIAPFDVYLPEYPGLDFNSINTIVQPDIMVICDPEKTIEKGCHRVPDRSIEILSPSSQFQHASHRKKLAFEDFLL